ncbi:MAG: LuxR C-terminal-related transcriptional regulator [Pseudomonadota bacterium]
MQLTNRDIRRLRQAMGAVGQEAFFPAFRNLLRARMPMATCLILRFDPGRAPVLLNAWLSHKRVPSAALTEYVENTYPFDPFYQCTDIPQGGALYRLPEIAPDRFFSSEYYLNYYRSTGLCDEVGLLVPLPGGSRAHVSLSRLEAMGPYKRREMHCLRHHAPLLLEMLTQHVTAISPAARPVAGDSPVLSDLIASYTEGTLSIRLTKREAQIAALVMQGHSNGSSALALGIARETCKVHRRNLYRKLAISSQCDLFGVLKHLL